VSKSVPPTTHVAGSASNNLKLHKKSTVKHKIAVHSRRNRSISLDRSSAASEIQNMFIEALYLTFGAGKEQTNLDIQVSSCAYVSAVEIAE
jgi:hypothetical protein